LEWLFLPGCLAQGLGEADADLHRGASAASRLLVAGCCEEYGQRVLRVRGQGSMIVLVTLRRAGGA
jgi:hypothetical protein